MSAGEVEGWTPLYARATEGGAEEFTRLHSDVPGWMRESLWGWLEAHISDYRHVSGGRGYWDPNPLLIREIERICRIDIHWTSNGSDFTARTKGLNSLHDVLDSNEIAFLTAVDLHLSRVTDSDDLRILEEILNDSASEWRVGQLNSKPALVKRIDVTVQNAAEELARQGTRPGRLLADAWRHAFSLQRDPSASYRCSVRSVEAAAGPVLTPDDPLPTLGKMISAFRDGKDRGKWNFAFTVDSTVNPKDVLLQMMQLLWTNEYSRHVNADPAAPLHVSQPEAESAVVLALTLVNWFTSGAVASV